MHEASLVRDLVHRIEAVAAAEQGRRVVGVAVWLGALSHFSASHFAEHFAEAAAGSIAEGAALDLTLSDDTAHPDAQRVMLREVTLED
jgi:hydrogenase nickel incorporation protein HypA/HybF